jgi:prepilin-type N-terminal cleavage/methylation domain-containing protein
MSAAAEPRGPRSMAHGFTLPELLVAMASAGLVLAGLVTFLMAGQRSFLVGSNQIEAQQNVRIAIARMIDEIRGSGNAPGAAGNCPARSAIGAGQTATSLTLQNDWNGDGCIDPGVAVIVNGSPRGEQVTYTFAGSQLLRQESAVNNAAEPVVGGIETLEFAYRDASGFKTDTAASICSVVVTIRTRPETRPSAAYPQGKVFVEMTDTARIRNPGCEPKSGA